MCRDNVAQCGFEFGVHFFPVDTLGSRARAPAKGGDPLRIAGKTGGERDETGCIVDFRNQPAAAVLNVFGRRRVVVGNHGKSARHRLDRHIAKRLGSTRKQEDVAACVVGREVLAFAHAREHVVWIRRLEGSSFRTVADDVKMNV